jgi:hypothetical protein
MSTLYGQHANWMWGPLLVASTIGCSRRGLKGHVSGGGSAVALLAVNVVIVCFCYLLRLCGLSTPLVRSPIRKSAATPCKNVPPTHPAMALCCSCNRTLSLPIPVAAGSHNFTILSESLGIDNGMSANSTGKVKGIIGAVTLGSLNASTSTYVLYHGRMRPLYGACWSNTRACRMLASN